MGSHPVVSYSICLFPCRTNGPTCPIDHQELDQNAVRIFRSEIFDMMIIDKKKSNETCQQLVFRFKNISSEVLSGSMGVFFCELKSPRQFTCTLETPLLEFPRIHQYSAGLLCELF